MGKLFIAVGVIVSFLVITSAPGIANNTISWRTDLKEKLQRFDYPGSHQKKAQPLSFFWSMQGPQGDPGPPGADGQDGAVGPMGPAGPPGQDGAPGIDGRDGVDGIDGQDGMDGIFTNGSDVYRRIVGRSIQAYDPSSPDDTTSVQVFCPPGGQVAGGGFSLRQPEPGGSLERLDEVAVLASEPRPGAGPDAEDGWRVVLTSRSIRSINAVIEVFVICID